MMTLDPDQMMREMLRNRELIEKNGRQVNEVLGGFSTLLEAERRSVGRLFFFYPYLLYVTRLTLYTLPVNHPTKLAIMAQIGRLTEEQQRILVGATSREEEGAARELMFGRVFVKDGSAPTRFREFNARTANPLGHPFIEAEGSEHIFTMFPPRRSVGVRPGRENGPVQVAAVESPRREDPACPLARHGITA